MSGRFFLIHQIEAYHSHLRNIDHPVDRQEKQIAQIKDPDRKSNDQQMF